jgi:hypothetical protein
MLSYNLLYENIKIRTYNAIILLVVRYECETWSLALREVQRLRAFKIRVLRRICVRMRYEVRGGWRKLHNEVHHNLYSSPSTIRMTK